MRNVKQYPITYAEAKSTFERLSESVSYEKTKVIGSLDHVIAQYLVDNFDQVWYAIFCGKEDFEGPGSGRD